MRIALLSPTTVSTEVHEKVGPGRSSAAVTSDLAVKKPLVPSSRRHIPSLIRTRKPDSTTSHSNSSSLSLRSSISTSSRSHSQSPTERTSEEAETQYLQIPVVAPRPQSQSQTPSTQRSAARSIHPPSTGGIPSLASGITTLQHNHQHVSVPSLLVDQSAITVSILPIQLTPRSPLFPSLFSYPRRAGSWYPFFCPV
jgi:hypothetical protein